MTTPYGGYGPGQGPDMNYARNSNTSEPQTEYVATRQAWAIMEQYDETLIGDRLLLDHPAVRSELYHTENAPHETAGVLRMFRAGVTGPQIRSLLHMELNEAVAEIKAAQDAESDAHEQGRPIYDAPIKKGTR